MALSVVSPDSWCGYCREPLIVKVQYRNGEARCPRCFAEGI